MNKKTRVFLSADGSLPTITRDEFLNRADFYDFLIVFSRDPNAPDFSGILKFYRNLQKGPAIAATEKFKKFKVIEKDILAPQGVNVFLLKNPHGP